MRAARGGMRLVLAATLAAVALAGCSHKGKAKTPAKLLKIVNPQVQPVEVWARSAGSGSGTYFNGYRIAVSDDAVFVGAIDGGVFAFNPKTGATIWRTYTKARVISGPTINGNSILVGTMDGQVIALKRSDGKQLWRAQAPSEALAPPVGSGDIVVAKAVDGREYGLDAGSGERKWAFDRNEPNLTLRGVSAPLIVGSRVYSGLDNGKLVELNLSDGSMVWEQAISVPTGRQELDRFADIDADLLQGPDGLFVVTYGGDLALVDLSTGDSRWRRGVKSYTGMTLGGDKLFVTDDDGTVWGFDAATGAAAWKQQDLKYRRLSAPAYYKGFVVVGDYKGYLHWLSPDSGKVVGRTRMSSNLILTQPVVGNDLLYVMDLRGDLKAYNIRPPR